MRKARGRLDILILGPVPPPLGGIAVHVSRLVPLLQNAGFRVGVLNHFHSSERSFVLGTLKRNPLNYYRLPKSFPARLVHYHHSRWSTLMAVAFGKGRGDSRYVITIHSGELGQQLGSNIPLIRRSTRWALRRFDAIIVVNTKISALMEQHIADRPIEVLPAFLEAGDDDAPYDAAIDAFLRSGRTLVVPLYRIRFLRDGRDVYGLDSAVEAFLTLARERPELRLAIFAAERPSGFKARNHLDGLLKMIEDARLSDRLLVEFGLPLVPAFRHDAILVRPTRTDGDALSIREALHAGLPVVASDAVERPSGTVTFGAGDVAALCAAVRQVLDKPSGVKALEAEEVGRDHTDAFLDRLLGLYEREMKKLVPEQPA